MMLLRFQVPVYWPAIELVPRNSDRKLIVADAERIEDKATLTLSSHPGFAIVQGEYFPHNGMAVVHIGPAEMAMTVSLTGGDSGNILTRDDLRVLSVVTNKIVLKSPNFKFKNHLKQKDGVIYEDYHFFDINRDDGTISPYASSDLVFGL